MKKIILAAAAFVAVVSLSSCAKSHTCTCNVTPTTGTAYSYVITYDKITTANAQLFCEGNSSQTVTTYPAPVGTSTGDKTVCTLK